MKRLKILIWHVHGSYLYYLTQAPHEFYLPSKPDRQRDYIGRYGHIPWGSNVHDVPVDQIAGLHFDCIVFQLPHQYLKDQFEILTPDQRNIPKIYLEHDPPQQKPSESKHWVDDPEVIVVHVTEFNRLMWDNGRSPTKVINHGVIIPPNIEYKGVLNRGIVVINHLSTRGRKLGKDIYEKALNEGIPLDLVGMEAEEMPGGLGEILHKDLPLFESNYRFFFNPIRYTSFPLSMCEAMMVGLPIVGLATTEIALCIKNDVHGYIDTNINKVVEYMEELLKDKRKAMCLGENARKYAQEHFNIYRFIDDWNAALAFATGFGGKTLAMKES